MLIDNKNLDITELRRVERELEKRKNDLENLAQTCNIFKMFFDHAPVSMGMIEVVDTNDFVHLFCNPSVAHLMNCNAVEELYNVR